MSNLKTKPMKLSKTQQDVIDLMRDGWELGESATFRFPGVTIQKGGIGRGGDSKRVNRSTFTAILSRGLIERTTTKHQFPTITYRLSEKGKSVEIDLRKGK